MDSVFSCKSYDLHERVDCSYRPSNLTKETSLFDCICRKAKIIAGGLILWFLSACWDRAGLMISKILLFASFHETLQPESSLGAVDFKIVHHTRYSFLFDSFTFLLCQWFTPSPGSPCECFDLRMLFCTDMLPLLAFFDAAKPESLNKDFKSRKFWLPLSGMRCPILGVTF